MAWDTVAWAESLTATTVVPVPGTNTASKNGTSAFEVGYTSPRPSSPPLPGAGVFLQWVGRLREEAPSFCFKFGLGDRLHTGTQTHTHRYIDYFRDQTYIPGTSYSLHTYTYHHIACTNLVHDGLPSFPWDWFFRICRRKGGPCLLRYFHHHEIRRAFLQHRSSQAGYNGLLEHVVGDAEGALLRTAAAAALIDAAAAAARWD